MSATFVQVIYEGKKKRAGEGNRTPVCSLGSCRSTIELHPQGRFSILNFRLPITTETNRMFTPKRCSVRCLYLVPYCAAHFPLGQRMLERSIVKITAMKLRRLRRWQCSYRRPRLLSRQLDQYLTTKRLPR